MSIPRITEQLQRILDDYDNNNCFDVCIQDQTTQILDLFFLQAIGAPTILAEAAKVDATTIEVGDATNFSVGNYLGLFVGGSTTFYFGEVLAVAGTTITLDTPINFDYLAGSNVISTSRELNVDGSVTPQVFKVQAGGGALVLDITRIMISMTHGSAGDDGLFGNLPALTNGIVLRQTNGVRVNIWNVKNNGEFANLAYDVAYPIRSGGQGTHGTRCRYTLNGQDKHGVTVRIAPGESLDIIIQDDLTNLTSFRMLAAGHVIDP